jgi:zinc transporter ZupT
VPPADGARVTGWPTQVGYVPALAVVGCFALAVALTAARIPVAVRSARAAAGGGILAILVVDLLPDTLAGAREEGIALWLVVVLVWGTFGLVGASRASHRHTMPDATPALLSVHGLVEGVVVGAGAGVNVVLGLPALLGMAIHKSVEGVDLALYLRTAEPGPAGRLALLDPGRRRVSWLTLNAAAPLAGVAAGHTFALPHSAVAVGTSMLSGLLLHVVFQTCVDLLEAPARRAPWLVFAGAFAATLLLAKFATYLSR